MITKHHNLKVFNIITVFVLAAMLLTACGSFSFQAQAQPDDGGGVGLSGSGGVEPVQPGVNPPQPGSDTTGTAPVGQLMVTPLTVIFLLAGFVVLVLILLLLVQRRSSGKESS